MRLGVGLLAVVGVVGDDRRDAQLLADLDEPVADPGLDVEAVVHQLEEVVLLAEDVLVLGGGPQRFVVLAEPQPGLHARPTGSRWRPSGRPTCSAMISLSIRAYLVSQPSANERRGELEQVVQALVVPGPDRLVQVGAGGGDVVPLLVRLAPQDAVLVAPVLRRDVRLDADDRGDPASLACRWNSAAPNMLPWSVIATCVMPVPATSLNSSLSRAAPSSIEYSVCTCRWA